MHTFHYSEVWSQLIPQKKFGAGVVLKTLFEQKQKKSKLSLRLFSKKIGLSPSMLTQVLNGKRNLALVQMNKVGEALQFSKTEKTLFGLMWKYSKVAALKPVDVNDQESLAEKIQEFYKRSTDQWISPKKYSILKNWKHLAVSDAIRTHKAGRTIEQISKILSMDSAVVNQSLQQLLAVGLVKQAESGRYQNAGSDEQFVSILINDDFYDYFKQIHDLSRAHMNFRKPDTEYVSVSCIPLNPEDRGRARELVDEMLIKLRLLSEKRDESSHVHTLLLHLFPLGDYQST